VTTQLFPRYIFARFVARNFLHKVSYTRGVHSIVSFGGRPTPVDDAIISLIRSHTDADGYAPLGEELKAGDKIVVKNGSLAKLVGVFERRLKGTDRVMILLTTVSYQVRVILEREQVRNLHPAEPRNFAVAGN
ncbi:MAG TPA: transcription termination/antitermination NusG family protein, partial [Pyrinomonadaceae bacterium]|nr:transcription termination/antitermination NusG family protein [Pyrinomonadaceae bacterium]